jgi:hypothetical protein
MDATGRAGNESEESNVQNLLLDEVEYKIEETSRGVWRRFVYPNGELFEEFVSHRRVLDLPLLHYTRGRCPETGKQVVAKGFIAIGRIAMGVIAIGHASFGLIAIGQLALGLLIGFGQATTGFLALGQLAIGGVLGLGQVATGFVTAGQLGFGHYVLAQIGVGSHVWDMRGADPTAQQFFRSLIP